MKCCKCGGYIEDIPGVDEILCYVCSYAEFLLREMCTHCKYSEYDERYPNTCPSLIICRNKESECYEKNNAWGGTCDFFTRKEQKMT